MHDNDELPLERRSRMLAERLVSRKNAIVSALKPAGQRPLFTKQLSQPEALKFWRQHRYTDIGKRVLERMSPVDVMELDQALSQQNAIEQTPEVDDGL